MSENGQRFIRIFDNTTNEGVWVFDAEIIEKSSFAKGVRLMPEEARQLAARLIELADEIDGSQKGASK